MTIYRNSYIINQSNSTTWKFFLKKDEGIIYKILKENTWSESRTLTREAHKNFSVSLLPNDTINVLYQDFDGSIILSKYDGEKWNKQGILTNKEYEKFNIYFKTAHIGNKIYIFFSIFDKEKNIASLFYQVLDEESNLSEPKIIDIVKYDYELPFTLYPEDDKKLFIIYQKFSVNHELGYKLLNKDDEKLSDYKLIDTALSPFKDYSVIMPNGNINVLYIKTEDNIDILNYVHNNNLKLSNSKLFKDSNIESCLISIIYGQIFCFWINNNKIYSNFSLDNGDNFSASPNEQLINCSDVLKSVYFSNNPEDRGGILVNELYFCDEDIKKYSFYSSLNSVIQNSDFLSYIKYYMVNVSSNILLYEKEIKEINSSNNNFTELNDQLMQKISWLEKSLNAKEEKLKSLKELNVKKDEEKNSFKDKLSENISIYQENLYDKENKIKLLEKINKEKEEELLRLKDKFSRNTKLYQSNLYQKDNRINSLEKINNEKEKEILLFKEKLSQNLNSLQNNSHDNDNKIKSLEEINNEKENEMLLLKESLESNEKEMKLLVNNNKEKQDEIAILNEKLSQNEFVILNLTKKIKDLNKNIKIIYSKNNPLNNKNY